jgi:transmembrane sensor
MKLAPRSMRAEAAAWIAKLHGPERSAELEADFQSWLKAHADHARAFENLTEIWESLGSVQIGGLPRLAVTDSFTVKSGGPRLAAAALAACLVIGIGALWLFRGETYVTGIGEQRVVSLEDGTRVSLNALTRMQVNYRQGERRVRLDGGEAFFEVAKVASRPFIVTAGERAVTALGTSFVVRYEPDRLAVTLVEGKIAVASLTPSPLWGEDRGEGSALAPGQRLTFVKNALPKIDTPRAESTMAWRRGEVILDDTPLADAVAEMNRYERTRIVLDDSRFKDFRVSGIYKTGDGRSFANAVAVAYGLDLAERDNTIHLTAR